MAGWEGGSRGPVKRLQGPSVSHRWLRAERWQDRWREVTVCDVLSEDTLPGTRNEQNVRAAEEGRVQGDFQTRM